MERLDTSGIPATPTILRTGEAHSDRRIGVDTTSNIIRGYVVAQLGEFKDKRGMFNDDSLNKIVELGNAAGGRGLRSRLSHPNESDDGLTKHLGRATNFRRDGESVRADLKIADVAMSEPVGGGKPLGQYVMELAQEDPGALSSSLVLSTEKLARTDGNGEQLPPLWTPTELFASDIVADGDAVHGDLLGTDALHDYMSGSARRIPTKLAVAGAKYLDQMFPDSDRDVVAARIDGFKNRYLAKRFGDFESDLVKESKAMVTTERLGQTVDQIRGKWDSQKELLRKSGYREKDKETWVRHQCRNEGIPYQQDALKNAARSQIEKLRAQWDQTKDQLKRGGYRDGDKETWVRHQCRDKGIAYSAD